MSTIRMIWTCLRNDPDSLTFVLLPLAMTVIFACAGQWALTPGFLIAALTGFKHALEWPERKAGAFVLMKYREARAKKAAE